MCFLVCEKRRAFEAKPKRYSLVQLELRARPRLADIEFALDTSTRLFDTSLVFSKSAAAQATPSAVRSHYRAFWSDLLDVNYLKKRVASRGSLAHDFLPLARLKQSALAKARELLAKQVRPLVERRMELERLNRKEHLAVNYNLNKP